MTVPIIVFKVALENRKSTWRRIAMRSNRTLDQLHEAIYSAFDRDDEHLYSFYFPKPGSRGQARLRNAREYTHPENAGDRAFGGGSRRSAANVKLSALRLRPGQTFLYLFDFGDAWLHEVKVEQVAEADDGGAYPRIIEKHGGSPPQYPDMG